jgi:hypothetical protein
MNKQLIGITKHFAIPVLTIITLFLFIPGCSRENHNRGKVVASVNKEQISLEDFQRELALRSKQNPHYKVTPEAVSEQLNTVIDRRLMVQEAMKRGLASNEDFIRTIQSFWEQTLIRELIEAKNHEWEGRLFVTEQEIHDYYNGIRKDRNDMPPLDKLYDQIKIDMLEEKKTNALDEWLTGVREKAAIDIDNELIDSYFSSDKKSVRRGGGDAR